MVLVDWIKCCPLPRNQPLTTPARGCREFTLRIRNEFVSRAHVKGNRQHSSDEYSAHKSYTADDRRLDSSDDSDRRNTFSDATDFAPSRRTVSPLRKNDFCESIHRFAETPFALLSRPIIKVFLRLQQDNHTPVKV